MQCYNDKHYDSVQNSCCTKEQRAPLSYTLHVFQMIWYDMSIHMCTRDDFSAGWTRKFCGALLKFSFIEAERERLDGPSIDAATLGTLTVERL
jgi:hypothetical protein